MNKFKTVQVIIIINNVGLRKREEVNEEKREKAIDHQKSH